MNNRIYTVTINSLSPNLTLVHIITWYDCNLFIYIHIHTLYNKVYAMNQSPINNFVPTVQTYKFKVFLIIKTNLNTKQQNIYSRNSIEN